MSAATYILAIIAGLSWARFLYVGFFTRGGFGQKDESVGIPLLWTILAVVA